MGQRIAISKACPARDVPHEITYILLRVVPCVSHPVVIYWGYRVWPGVDELLDFVDPEEVLYSL
jgi:hypothetical protein